MSDIQKEALANVFKKSDLPLMQRCLEFPDSHDQILREIGLYDDAIIAEAMGDLGLRLKMFAAVTDHDHPEMEKVLDGVFSASSEVSHRLCETLQLFKYAKEQGMTKVLPFFHKLAIQKLTPEFKAINSPEKNQQLIRLLKDPEKRRKVRLTKSTRPVVLKHFYNKGRQAWESLSDDFAFYVRFSTAYQSEIEQADEKRKRYLQLGCNDLAEGIQQSIDQFVKRLEDVHYGFHRITMNSAAVILAKLHGFKFVDNRRRLSGRDVPYNIEVRHEFLKDFIYPEDSAQHSRRSFTYSPRAYPLCVFEGVQGFVPQEIVEVVAHLEAMPEMGERPMFDHYVVLVPGAAYPPSQNCKNSNDTPCYAFKAADDGVSKYQQADSAYKMLDQELILSKKINPVLLGERNGKCYFICHWHQL